MFKNMFTNVNTDTDADTDTDTDADTHANAVKNTITPEQSKKLEVFYKILDVICTMMEENNIPFYLDCGTLLGCIREGRLLKNDTDIDLTIHLSFWEKLSKMVDFSKYGLEVKKITQGFPNYDYGNMITLNLKNTNSDYYCDIYANPAFPLLDISKMNNKEYPVPKDPGLYLTQLYGNWKVPSSIHAYTTYHRNNGLIFSEYKKNWDLKYNIYKCYF